MVVTLNSIKTQILGAALVELLSGELSDETIAAVDSVEREDVPASLGNLVGMIHGVTTHPPMRETAITNLIDEIRSSAVEVLENRIKHPSPISGDWIVMYNILETILDGGDYDLRGTADMLTEAGSTLGNIDRVPAWAQPLVEHVNNSTTQGDELTLHLLDILEDQIQKRRARLIK